MDPAPAKAPSFSSRRPGISLLLFALAAACVPFLGGVFLIGAAAVLSYLGARGRRRARARFDAFSPIPIREATVGAIVRVRGRVVGRDGISPLAGEPGVWVRSVVARQRSNIGHEDLLWSKDQHVEFEVVDGSDAVLLTKLDDAELDAAIASETMFGTAIPDAIESTLGADVAILAAHPVDDLSYVFREIVLKNSDAVEVDGQVVSEEKRNVGGFRDVASARCLAIRPVRVSTRFGAELAADAKEHGTTVGAVVAAGLGAASIAIWWSLLGD